MIRKNTLTKLYNPTAHNRKFSVNDVVKLVRTYGDDSKKLKRHVGEEGTIIGYRDYYHGRGGCGNRYYMSFNDGYVAGVEPMLLRKA